MGGGAGEGGTKGWMINGGMFGILHNSVWGNTIMTNHRVEKAVVNCS